MNEFISLLFISFCSKCILVEMTTTQMSVEEEKEVRVSHSFVYMTYNWSQYEIHDFSMVKYVAPLPPPLLATYTN